MQNRLAIGMLLLFAPLAAGAAPDDVPPAQAIVDGAAEAYEAGRFEEAANQYIKAYDLVSDPILLKNAIKILAVHIGDCQRLGPLAERYLATQPEAARVQEVDGYRADCRLADADAHTAAGRFAEA